jgi:hypothetical protein
MGATSIDAGRDAVGRDSMHNAIWRRCLLAAWVLALVHISTPVPDARALDVIGAEMQPFDDEIASHMEAIEEIKRQGQNRVTRLHRWIEWWTKVKDLASATADRLKKNFDERIDNAEKARALLAQLFVEKPEDERNIPHIGWQNAASMAQFINNLRGEATKWAQLAAEGKAEWHYAAVGWITGQAIQYKIDDLQKQIRDINQGLGDGTLEVHIVGYGWIKERPLRDAIAAANKRKEEIRQRIAAGDYEVCIPGLGVRTRKSLDAEIAAAQAELDNRRSILARGELAIYRPAIDWKNLNQLRYSIDQEALAYDVMKKTVNDGVYTVWLVETDWAKRVDLENRVKQLEDTIAATNAAIGKKEYNAQTAIGWSTSKAIEAYIEDLSKQLNNPQLDAKGREYLSKQLEKAQKALSEVQAISAYDLAILALEKAKYSRLITEVMKLARPDFERRDLERIERDEALADFPIEGALGVKQAERRLNRLRKAREWIPG